MIIAIIMMKKTVTDVETVLSGKTNLFKKNLTRLKKYGIIYYKLKKDVII